MKLFVALCTIVTLQLCFLKVSALEDQDMNMDMELAARELEEDDEDTKARPSKHPFCVRTNRDGWGGQCLFPVDLVNVSCDFIHPSGNDIESLCRDSDQRCCVNCYAAKQYENCRNIGAVAPTRRECCPPYLVLRTMESGCNCCGKCKPSRRYCTKDGGFCVTRDDPVYNFEYCEEVFGPDHRLIAKRCDGKHCHCCLPPR